MDWFKVDREGLSKLLERRPKGWVLAELLQNAWDAPGVTKVALTVSPVPGKSLTEITIEDDSPEGFLNLDHSFTLFAQSSKKGKVDLRGRFNLGEKLVLSLCKEASVASTTGTIVFDSEGRKSYPRRKREAGTVFHAVAQLNREEMADALAFVQTFIPPVGIETTINGKPLLHRQPLKTFEWTLTTEVAGEDGVLRRTKRKAPISVYAIQDGAPGRILEMGIPIVETPDQFDVDIGQKVPLSMERDSVTPAYLRDLRVAVLTHTADLLTAEDAAKSWVNDAITDKEIDGDVVAAVVTKRFGDKIVSYDPSDIEANSKAVSRGYTVIHGGAFSRSQWENLRKSGVIQPAGVVAPTPKPFSPDGEPAEHVAQTAAMSAFSDLCKQLAREIMGVDIQVSFLKTFNATAAYGGRHLSFNMSRLGKRWFEGPINDRQLDLVVHEFGHEYEGDHLSESYYRALTKIAGKMAILALEKPHLFQPVELGTV